MTATLALARTLDAAHVAAARALRDGGIGTPALDARVLLCHSTGLSHEALIAHGGEPLPPAAAARLTGYVARRLAGEPVSRIKGTREFYGRDFRIDPHTLDPRPDTETLIGAALRIVTEEGLEGQPLRLLDLGTGSGCILLTLLAELPNAEGIGTDLSSGALRLAAANARHLGVEGRTRLVAADWFEGLSGQFDLILTNPPYIAAGEIAALSPEVAGHDPRAALDGGADGLDAYRSIAAKAAAFLAPGGHLLVEIGPTQVQAVARLFRAAGLAVDEGGVLFDLAGRPRGLHAISARGVRGTSQASKNKLGKPGCSG